MKKQIAAVTLAGFLVCACQSISNKQTLPAFPPPPAGVEPSSVDGATDPLAVDHALERQYRDNPTEPMRFLVRYLQAKLWSPIDESKACALWLELSENSKFPLLRVARVRSIETCPTSRSELAPMLLAESATPPEAWMKEASLRSNLSYSVRAKDAAREMRLSIEVARLEKLQTAQVKLLTRARELARGLNDSAAEAEALERLEKIAPRLISEPKADQYLAVANDFKKSRAFDEARSYYRKIVDGDFNDYDKLRALDGIRMSFKLEQKREKYVEATRDYSEFARTKMSRKSARANQLAKYLDTRLTLARAVWTENSATDAEEILVSLERELRGRYPIDEILFLRARIAEEAGHLDRTVELLSRISDSRLSDKASRLKVAWYRAWSLRKIGRLPEAAVILEKLARDEATSPQEARDRFWLARTYAQMGDRLSAGAQYAWLTNNDPLGYYGLLVYRELKQPMPGLANDVRLPAATSGPPPVAPLVRGDDGSRALNAEERLTFEWLVAGSEGELARRYLDATASERRSTFTEEQTVDFLKAYARAGAYQSLFGRLYELKPEVRRQILDKQPELIFPQPWNPLVEKSAKRFDLKTGFIYSIMRQESSFNPRARSFADAFGLMQLIPEVAERAGKGAGLKIAHPEDLYRPETNIPLGSAFLRELLNKWDNRFIPAVASYNASEVAVTGWLRTRDRQDPLAFIEDIPYEETKGYVKLVMRNFVFYSRLNSQAGTGTPFPEWCLSGIQDIKL